MFRWKVDSGGKEDWKQAEGWYSGLGKRVNPAPTTPSQDSSANKEDGRGQWVWALGFADGLGSQSEEKGNQRYSPGFWTELMVLLPEMGKNGAGTGWGQEV